jgi:hypothetical protein
VASCATTWQVEKLKEISQTAVNERMVGRVTTTWQVEQLKEISQTAVGRGYGRKSNDDEASCATTWQVEKLKEISQTAVNERMVGRVTTTWQAEQLKEISQMAVGRAYSRKSNDNVAS